MSVSYQNQIRPACTPRTALMQYAHGCQTREVGNQQASLSNSLAVRVYPDELRTCSPSHLRFPLLQESHARWTTRPRFSGAIAVVPPALIKSGRLDLVRCACSEGYKHRLMEQLYGSHTHESITLSTRGRPRERLSERGAFPGACVSAGVAIRSLLYKDDCRPYGATQCAELQEKRACFSGESVEPATLIVPLSFHRSVVSPSPVTIAITATSSSSWLIAIAIVASPSRIRRRRRRRTPRSAPRPAVVRTAVVSSSRRRFSPPVVDAVVVVSSPMTRRTPTPVSRIASSSSIAPISRGVVIPMSVAIINTVAIAVAVEANPTPPTGRRRS